MKLKQQSKQEQNLSKIEKIRHLPAPLLDKCIDEQLAKLLKKLDQQPSLEDLNRNAMIHCRIVFWAFILIILMAAFAA